MKTVEEQIEHHKEELERLEEVKKHEENSLIARTSRVVAQSGFTDWTSQTIKDVKIYDTSAWYGDDVEITVPIGYCVFNLIDNLYLADLYVSSISTSNDALVISVTDEVGIACLRREKEK